ncbi:unnamed protein product, partial [Brachionus calyciflorus]
MSGKSKKSKPSPPKKTTKKPKKNEETDQSDISNSEEEVEVKKISQKKSKDDEIEMIAIVYDIPNSKHPFYHLNEVPSSVEISKVLDSTERNEIKKGAIVSFVHEENGHHIMGQKFIKENNEEPKNSILEKSILGLTNQLVSFRSNIQKSNDELKALLIETFSNNATPVVSPQIKRKVQNRDDSSDSRSDAETLIEIYKQKDFTKQLKKEINEKFPEHPHETMLFYEEKDHTKIIEIK